MSLRFLSTNAVKLEFYLKLLSKKKKKKPFSKLSDLCGKKRRHLSFDGKRIVKFSFVLAPLGKLAEGEIHRLC